MGADPSDALIALDGFAGLGHPRRRPAEPLLKSVAVDLEGRSRTIAPGLEFIFEGHECPDTIWLLSGWISVWKSLEDGRRQIIDVLLPVDLIRLRTEAPGSSLFGLTALTQSRVAALSNREVEDLCSRHSGTDNAIRKLGAAATARQTERMLRLGKGTAHERVAEALLEIALRLEAVSGREEHHFKLPMTQKEIGDLTGLTSVHVCRVLKHLTRDGVIKHPDHEILIEDFEALCRISRVDLDLFRDQIAPSLSTESV